MGEFKKAFLRPLMISLYFPVSFCLIGILAHISRLGNPITNSYAFKDVFNYYVYPAQPGFIHIHIPALIFSFMVLILLVSMAHLPKPLLTLYQVRHVLLMLLGVFTILVKIFLTVLVYAPFRPPDLEEFIYIPLFLYLDAHILFLYLVTYLTKFKKLNTTFI
jgi:hypothetical protein